MLGASEQRVHRLAKTGSVPVEERATQRRMPRWTRRLFTETVCLMAGSNRRHRLPVDGVSTSWLTGICVERLGLRSIAKCMIGFAKLLEKRFDHQPCSAGILYECMRFLIRHSKVNAAEEFLSFGCVCAERRLVSADINRIINVALCFGHGILLDPEAGILCPFQSTMQGCNCEITLRR